MFTRCPWLVPLRPRPERLGPDMVLTAVTYLRCIRCSLFEDRWTRVQLLLWLMNRVQAFVDCVSRLFPLGPSLMPRMTALTGTLSNGTVPFGPTLVPPVVMIPLFMVRCRGVRTQVRLLLLHPISVTKVAWPGLHLTCLIAVGMLNPAWWKLMTWQSCPVFLFPRYTATCLAPPWLFAPTRFRARAPMGWFP